MSVPVWPETLPDEALIEGYSRAFPNKLLRSSMETGPAKVRRRVTSGVAPLKGAIYMSRAQLTTFTTFYETTLAGGSLRFSWTDPVTNTSVEIRFAEPPSWTLVGVEAKVEFSLEILP